MSLVERTFLGLLPPILVVELQSSILRRKPTTHTFSMPSPTTIPCIDKDIVDCNSSRDDTLVSTRTTSLTPSSNSRTSFYRGPNEVTNVDRRMLVAPTVMAMQGPSRLRMSRQSIVVQPLESHAGPASPSTKRSRMEEKDGGKQTLPLMRAKKRAMPSNHGLPNSNVDSLSTPALSPENSDDTPHNLCPVTEQQEILMYSSPGTTQLCSTERSVVLAENAASDGTNSCQNRPMKRAKNALTSEVKLVIRVPTPAETHSDTTIDKTLEVTNKNHITRDNTATVPSPKIEDTKNNPSMAVVVASATAVANSSTTESSSKLTPTPISLPATASPSRANSSDNMNAAGKLGRNSLPPTQKASPNNPKLVNNTNAVASKDKVQIDPKSLAEARTNIKEPTSSKSSATEAASQKFELVQKVAETKPVAVVKESPPGSLSVAAVATTLATTTELISLENSAIESSNQNGRVLETLVPSKPAAVVKESVAAEATTTEPISSENSGIKTSNPDVKVEKKIVEAKLIAVVKESAPRSSPAAEPTPKTEISSKISATKTPNPEVQVVERKVQAKPVAVSKDGVRILKKPATSATMSIIKKNPVGQTVASTSTVSLPANQVQTVGSGTVKTNNSTSNIPTVSSPNKRKKSTASNKRKRTANSSSQKSKGQSSGRWTQAEHQAFLEGLTECGREWKKVALRIPTRTSAQIRSHAQKYFAKLQRDQESSASNANMSFVHGDLSTPIMTLNQVRGDGGRLPGTIITAPSAASLAPSVRRKVERIVANPRAAQREVEETMEALRQRYRQLQQRLEERRRNREERKKQRQQPQSQPLSTASSNTGLSSEISAFASPPSLPQNKKELPHVARKRMNLPLNNRKQDSRSSDDGSSVSSNVSSIAASRTDLGNGEIIALQVLGDALPRSESANDLHVLGAEALQGRGDSSIEVDGTMPSINDNISSSSYDLLAPLPGDGCTDNDSLMNQGASVATNDNNSNSTRNVGDTATSGSLSVGGISTV